MATRAELNQHIKNGKKKRIINTVINVICIPLVFLVFCMAISLLVATSNNTAPSFANHSLVVISSGSMEASGFEVGSVALIKNVNKKNLKVGDIIAYYEYDLVSVEDAIVNADATNFDNGKAKTSIASWFGIPDDNLKNAGASEARIIFHQIVEVKETETGERLFQTYGTSNNARDGYYVKEEYVIGKFSTNGGIFKLLSVLYKRNMQVLIVVVPIIIISFIIAYDLCLGLNTAFLEKEVLDKKRRLDDPRCIESNVGYGMSNKVKYLVLKDANPKDRIYYVPLLWKNAERPAWIQKHYYKQDLMLKKYEKLELLKTECNERIKYGESKTKVAKYYNKQKEIINREIEEFEEKLKKMNKDDHLKRQQENLGTKLPAKAKPKKSTYWT